MTRLHAAFETTAGRAVPGQRDREFQHAEPQERTLYAHPHDARALIEPTRDGNDYYRVCARHQWCSAAVTLNEYLGECPACLAEVDGSEGRKRYAALHAAHVRIVGAV